MILIIKHIDIEGPGVIGDFFRNSDYETRLVDLANGGDLEFDFDKIEAAITLGGPMNVDEAHDYPFLRMEIDFLEQAMKRRIPLLGICLGAQLIAKAAGSKIKRGQAKELGWYKIKFSNQAGTDPLLKSCNLDLDFFQWHEDKIEAPKNALLLAASSAGPQIFRIGDTTYGFQCHFEVTPFMVETWIRVYRNSLNGLNSSDIAHILNEAYKKREEFESRAHRICLNFARIIERNCVKKT